LVNGFKSTLVKLSAVKSISVSVIPAGAVIQIALPTAFLSRPELVDNIKASLVITYTVKGLVRGQAIATATNLGEIGLCRITSVVQ
jgi:hypothetical protein